jgi:hypothetical protein
MRPRHLGFTLLLALGAAACAAAPAGDPDPCAVATGPTMLPGRDCLSCHDRQSGTCGAPHWFAAGTVFARPEARSSEGVEGVSVILVDAAGREHRKVTNRAGNFWFPDELTAPFKLRLEHQGRTAMMVMPAPGGTCNFCHSRPPFGGAPGRIFAP